MKLFRSYTFSSEDLKDLYFEYKINGPSDSTFCAISAAPEAKNEDFYARLMPWYIRESEYQL